MTGGEFCVDHIDPRNGELVCGLCVLENEIISDPQYNGRKTNRFVPYRVKDHSPPSLFGDIGEFLVDGEWTVCEFGGPEWWAESNKIGNSQTNGGRTSIRICNQHQNTVTSRRENARRHSQSERNRESMRELSKKNWNNPETYLKMTSHLEESGKKGRQTSGVTQQKRTLVISPSGEELIFDSLSSAAKHYGLGEINLRAVARGKRPHHKGYVAKYI